MCMVFDMTGAGLSNMDMDLVRFVVNCFKIYFPDLLQWLLVYNMPWVLQGGWGGGGVWVGGADLVGLFYCSEGLSFPEWVWFRVWLKEPLKVVFFFS